jgi:hypothetical protein
MILYPISKEGLLMKAENMIFVTQAMSVAVTALLAKPIWTNQIDDESPVSETYDTRFEPDDAPAASSHKNHETASHAVEQRSKGVSRCALP